MKGASGALGGLLDGSTLVFGAESRLGRAGLPRDGLAGRGLFAAPPEREPGWVE